MLDNSVCRSMLLATHNITDQNMFLFFNSNNVFILDRYFRVIATGRCAKNKLYYFNLRDLLALPPQRSPTPNVNNLDNQYPIQVNTNELSQSNANQIQQLHEALGHTSYPNIAKSIENGAYKNCSIPVELIKKFGLHFHCIQCQLAARNKLPRGLGSGIKPTLGTTLSYDYVGPFPTSVFGHTGIHLIMECAVNFLLYEFTNLKNNLIEFLYRVLLYFHCYNFKISVLRYDYGTVENSEAVNAFLKYHKIESQHAAPEAQEQNPIERTIQTAKKKVAAIRQDAPHLKDNTWIFAWINFISNWNAATNTNSGNKSPNQHITKQTIDLSNHANFKFGQTVASFKTGKQVNIAMPIHGELGYFVARSDKLNKANWIYFPQDHRLSLRANVQAIHTFNESAPHYSYNNLPTGPNPYTNTSTRADNNIHTDINVKLDDQQYQLSTQQYNLEYSNIPQLIPVQVISGPIDNSSSSTSISTASNTSTNPTSTLPITNDNPRRSSRQPIPNPKYAVNTNREANSIADLFYPNTNHTTLMYPSTIVKIITTTFLLPNSTHLITIYLMTNNIKTLFQTIRNFKFTISIIPSILQRNFNSQKPSRSSKL